MSLPKPIKTLENKERHLSLNGLENLTKQNHQSTKIQLRFHLKNTITYVVDDFFTNF